MYWKPETSSKWLQFFSHILQRSKPQQDTVPVYQRLPFPIKLQTRLPILLLQRTPSSHSPVSATYGCPPYFVCVTYFLLHCYITEQPLCPPPPQVSNTLRSGQQQWYYEQDTVYYDCNAGYHLRGPSLLTCIRSGRWSPPEYPSCLRESLNRHISYKLLLNFILQER